MMRLLPFVMLGLTVGVIISISGVLRQQGTGDVGPPVTVRDTLTVAAAEPMVGPEVQVEATPFRLVAFRPYVNRGPGPLTEEQLTYMIWESPWSESYTYFTDMAEVLGRCYDSLGVGLAGTEIGPVTEEVLMAECEAGG